MANTAFKVENGLVVVGTDTNANASLYVNTYIQGNLTVNGNLVLVTGNLQVLGNLTYSNTSLSGDLSPLIDQSRLGNTTNRFNGSFYDSIIYNTLMPSTNGIAFGNSTARYSIFATNVNSSGNVVITGNLTVNGTALVVNPTGLVGVNTTSLTNTFNVSGTVGISANCYVGGNIAVTGVFTSNGITAGNTTIYSNSATTTTTAQLIIDSFPKTQARTAKYWVTVQQSTSNDIHTIEMLMIQDLTFVYLTKYAEIFTTSLGTFDAAINTANVEVYFTAGVANNYSIKVARLQLL